MATATDEPLIETVAPPSAPVVPEGVLYDVIDGKVVEQPPMGALQALIATTLTIALSRSGGGVRTGRVVTECLFKLDPDRNQGRRPDVAFVSFERWPRKKPVPETETWEVVPDLAVEVTSPSNSATEVVAKIDEYFRAGVRAVWVVYPGQRKVYDFRSPTDVRIFQDGDDLDGGDVVPGFRLTVKDLLADASEEEPGPAAPGS